MALALCIPDDILSMYQVLFNSLLYFQRYAPDKLNITKNRKGSNSVNTGDRVMILVFCDFSHDPLSVYQVSFNSIAYFQRLLRTSFLLQKLKRQVTPLILLGGL